MTNAHFVIRILHFVLYIYFPSSLPRLHHCVDSQIDWCTVNTHMGHHVDSRSLKCTVRYICSYTMYSFCYFLLVSCVSFWWGPPVVFVVHQNIRTNQSERMKHLPRTLREKVTATNWWHPLPPPVLALPVVMSCRFAVVTALVAAVRRWL